MVCRLQFLKIRNEMGSATAQLLVYFKQKKGIVRSDTVDVHRYIDRDLTGHCVKNLSVFCA